MPIWPDFEINITAFYQIDMIFPVQVEPVVFEKSKDRLHGGQGSLEIVYEKRNQLQKLIDLRTFRSGYINILRVWNTHNISEVSRYFIITWY